MFRKSPIPGLRIAARLTATAMVVSLASGDLRAPAAELTAPSIQATIDRGTITALHRSPSGPNMLRAPVKVEITPGTAAPIAEDATTLVSMSAAGRRAAAERSSEPEGLSWRHEWEVNHGSLAIRTTFTNLASERRSVGISWRFAFDGADCEPFFSGEHLAPEWPASEVSWYSYLTDRDDAHRLNIPLWCIYSPGRNFGATVAADMQSPILPFGVRVERLSDEVVLTMTRPEYVWSPSGRTP